jgi:prevent-host-death family protein
MAQTISQRELRNDSGKIMRRLDQGESFVITRNGQPVGELTPLRRHRSHATRWLQCSLAPSVSTSIDLGPILMRMQAKKLNPAAEPRE